MYVYIYIGVCLFTHDTYVYVYSLSKQSRADYIEQHNGQLDTTLAPRTSTSESASPPGARSALL